MIAVVDNKELDVGMTKNPLRILQNSEGKWKLKEKSR